MSSPEPGSGPGPSPDRRSDGRRRRASSARRGNRVAGPIDAFHIMTEADEAKADEALERLLEADSVEEEILAELVSAEPLDDVAGFAEMHRTFVRALEIYDRNARRPPVRLPASFLRPVVTPVVGLLVRVMSDAHQKRVVREVRKLYLLREATSPVGSAAHRALVSARRQLDNLLPELTGGGLAVPAFLVGGAIVSAVVSFLQDLVRTGGGRSALLVVLLLLTVGAFWCIITAAAVTRRRTRLVLDQPLRALWDTIGSAGPPPHDPSRTFVAVATGLLVLGWVIAPLVAAVVYSLVR